ncbi:hypothetical protein [Streptomyces sporangiiformans]|nr:hypothetical protein [Streptomyces sporangiiformans]
MLLRPKYTPEHFQKIHWKGTCVNVEQSLPDGEFGAQQDVIVLEIQAVNR